VTEVNNAKQVLQKIMQNNVIFSIESTNQMQQLITGVINCCIWLDDSIEYMKMHGLTNPKFINVLFIEFIAYYTQHVELFTD
jgi:hypothetical protein